MILRVRWRETCDNWSQNSEVSGVERQLNFSHFDQTNWQVRVVVVSSPSSYSSFERNGQFSRSERGFCSSTRTMMNLVQIKLNDVN